MKRIAYICVILLCSISFAFAQGAKPGRTNTSSKKVVKKTVVSSFAEAEKTWIPFWTNFKKAIKNRDKNSFKELIIKDYDFNTYGGGSCNETADKRDMFFCYASERDNSSRWWGELNSWLFDKRTRIEKIKNEDGEISRSVSLETNRGLNGNAAEFSYEKDKKWYLTRTFDWNE